MVQNQVVQRVTSTVCHQKPRKSMKRSTKNGVKVIPPKSSEREIQEATLSPKEKQAETVKSNDVEGKARQEEEEEEERTVIPLKEEMRNRRIQERLAREKQAEEERDRIVREAEERKAAEREEIIRQAKRLILYRKPTCRRINQGLLVSECYRELDAQIQFRESIRDIDREAEVAYANSIKEDVAKYEEEMKRETEERLEKRRNYAAKLKKQIEGNREAATAKEKEEFEAEMQDQLNMHKCLEDMKAHDAQELQSKKERLKKFFNDAIEEKKQFDLKLKHEDEFEDRANEIYRNAKLRIQKLHKEVAQKEKKRKQQKAQIIEDKFREIVLSKPDMEEQTLKKAQAEQEEEYQEKQRKKKERGIQVRKELEDFRLEVKAMKSKQLEEEKVMKTWELVQRFKKVECDKEAEAEERKQMWNKKREYGKSLKKYIGEKEAERIQEKAAEEKALDMTKLIIETENKKVLDYAEEVINESKGVRPLFPILKAVEECKKEMGLILPKKRGEVEEAKPKRKRRAFRCTKFVPEEKIHYL